MANAEHAQDDLLSVGLPVEFKRMLSWQLSAPSLFPVKKQKKKRQGSLPHGSDSEEGGESDFDYGVVVVNSDGENEVYYSAPESPVSSDSEQGSLATEVTTVEDTPTKQSRIKGKSKKQKKKLRYMFVSGGGTRNTF